MAQSIPSVPPPPGHLSFCFGKAANAPGGILKEFLGGDVSLGHWNP